MTGAPDTIAEIARRAGDLDVLRPCEFVEALADTIPAMAAEFGQVTLTISRHAMPQFCADLRRGMVERAIEGDVAAGGDAAELRDLVDPAEFDLPRRLEAHVRVAPSATFTLEGDIARLLAVDLACGIAYRPAGDG